MVSFSERGRSFSRPPRADDITRRDADGAFGTLRPRIDAVCEHVFPEGSFSFAAGKKTVRLKE